MTADLYFRDEVLRGGGIDERASRVAGGLAALGVQEGDVIAVMLRNDPAFIELIQASRIAGCYYCPINWHFRAAEVAHILEDSGARVLFVHEDLLGDVQSGLPAGLQVFVVPRYPARSPVEQPRGATDYRQWLEAQAPYSGPPRVPRGHMVYTSGTTGRPKGVVRRPVPDEDRAAAQARIRPVVEQAWGIRPGVRAMVPAPLYHSAPSSFAAMAMQEAELLVLAPRFDAEETLAQIERHRVDTVYLVPIMYVRLLRLPEAVRQRYDLSSVRFVASTGAPCPPQVKQAMLDWWGPVIHETYASSETGMITIQDPESARRKPESVGRPLGDAEIRIIGEDGTECPPWRPGVIYCRQPAFSDFTYANRPEAREEAGLGHLVTVGDVGYLDDEGYLYVCDRASDMVISGGVNIYPAEIEHVLAELPGVADSAVFGVADPEYGESLVAAIQPEPGVDLDAAAVRAHVADRLAGYKVPRSVHFLSQFPREDSGKVAKHRLRRNLYGEAGRFAAEGGLG